MANRKPRTVDKEKLALIAERLNPQKIRQEVENEIKQRKKELLANSYSFEDLAEKYHISARGLREYTSGKKVPRLGKTATAVGFVEENYTYDPESKRWFPRAN
jgi:hypothetical protein